MTSKKYRVDNRSGYILKPNYIVKSIDIAMSGFLMIFNVHS